MDEVHLWKISLDSILSKTQFQNLSWVLSENENKRAKGFFFEKDMINFVISHAILRIILSIYVGVDPKIIQFSYGRYGKPFLADGSNGKKINFNLSHSGDAALVGITCNNLIGVDIEKMCDDTDVDAIMEMFFPELEAVLLRKYDDYERNKLFFISWTCKEAFTKAMGEGLNYPFKRLHMPGLHGKSNFFVYSHGSSNWSLIKLSPYPDHVAAVAVEGERKAVKCWDSDDLLNRGGILGSFKS